MNERLEYSYRGPRGLLDLVRPALKGRAIRSPRDLTPTHPGEIHTFVIDTNGTLRLAPRRSEHVVCAGGENVLSAGEIQFDCDDQGWYAAEISNQSTGYCPAATSWPFVARALSRAGIRHPEQFTHSITFRICQKCGHLNIVREDWFFCVFCDSQLQN